MRHALWIGAALLLLAGPAPAKDQPAALDATQVVVRGKTDLGDAIRAALHPLLGAGPREKVLVVVDVSPNVLAKRDLLATALRGLGDESWAPSAWSLAALGGDPTKGAAGPGGAADAVPRVLTAETPAVDTLQALQRTIDRWRGRDGAILYVADWRFEDDANLEEFIRDLVRKGNVLTVVGTEAAFGRGWNDGWVADDERFQLDNPMGMQPRDYHEGIGRSPFGKADHDAPWHGGDCAYPHAPYRWHNFLWKYEFTEFDFEFAENDGALGIELGEDGEPKDFEDLEKRLKDKLKEGGGFDPPQPPDAPVFDKDANRYFPIPSSYGPYGLMRAAGATGGRYVLWSWNPGGRRQVRFEYARCNLFPPDLRPRAEMLKTLRKNDCAAATLRAWQALEAAPDSVIAHNAPLKSNLRTARAIDRFPLGSGTSLMLSWESKGDWRTFQRAAEDALEALDEAAKHLDAALAGPAPEGLDAVGQRYRADALLMRHAVRVTRLEIAEGLHASRNLPDDAWSAGTDRIPGVASRPWIPQGRDPDKVTPQEPAPNDTEAAQAVLAERKELLRRYRGTPFAEIVALNDVEPLRFVWWQRGGEMPDLGRSPSESVGGTKGAPGAPSTGGGPTTGK